ncbi:Kap120p [Saccharomyces cerevisiae YJM1527]|nr:Kap120p [Saccharomyces cerevisiae YJM1527]
MASSLNELNLVQVLEQASNPQHIRSDVQKLAEQQLKQWETQAGFHYLLQSIYLNLSNSLQIRWLAVIQFKNGVDKYWRSTRINAIPKDEKASIRGRLFEMIDEQNNQLCIQNAQASARIARLDFPVEWPTLFEDLENLLNDEIIRKDSIKIYNILMHINQIVKVLGTARIGRCRPAMQSKVPLILRLIVRIYLQSFEEWTTSSNLNYEDLSSLQVSYLALKVLRRIICEGYERPQTDQSVCDFIKLSVSHFEMLISNYENFKKFDIYEKFIKCLGKLYFNLVTGSPANFILLPCSTQILITYTRLIFDKAPKVYRENSDVTGDFWEQTAIRGLLILKRVINFIHKKGAITLKARSDKLTIDASINKINTEFLNENLITRLVDTLMEWYLRLRPTELENWFMDPEEWINEQMATSYEYQIRPCAENVFQDLMNTFSELLVPYLLKKIENDASKLSNSLDDFLRKDAIYASFQLSASAVSEMVDFDRLLIQVFLPEATNTNISGDELRIIRRRVALIINEWSTVKCSEESKSLCYKLFTNFLTDEDDKVVLLTTVQTVRTMVDDWNFNKDTFQPFLTENVHLLLRKILPSVSLTETRLYVLNTLSDIIIQTKPLISRDLLVEILQIIPNLWEIATNNASEAILANALLRLLRNLVSSLGSQSHLTWDIAIPVVALACDPSSMQYQLLSEDGYELWGMLLQNFSSHDQEFDDKFVELVPFLKYGIETHTEILPTLLEIIKSYALILNPVDFFSNNTFQDIFKQMSKYLLKLREDSFQLVLEIWEILILSNESDYENLLLQKFYETGVLSALFDAIFLEEAPSSYLCSQIIQIIARISYVNPDALMTFLATYHDNLPTSNENARMPESIRKIVSKDQTYDSVVNKLLTGWIVCFRDIFDPKFKKVHILGISSLLRTGLVPILTEFSSIASLWIEMLEEINETNRGDCEKYHLNDIVTEQSIAFHPLTAEQLRYHQLCKNNDPVHNISLKDFISQSMEYLESHLGVERYQEFLKTINPSLLENLQMFLSIQPQEARP